MTTQEHDLSAHAITTAFEEDAEHKLALVREQIAEADSRLADLRRSEEVLVKILNSLREGRPQGAARKQPEPNAQPLEGDDAEATSTAPAHPAAAASGPGSSRRAPKVATKATTRPGKAAARKTPAAAPSPRREAAASGAGVATLPERVVEFLIANPGPQKASEITTGLFGSSAPPARATQVRTTAERLVKRGEIEKERQGSTVFYQHTGAHTPTAAAPDDAAGA